LEEEGNQLHLETAAGKEKESTTAILYGREEEK
jgi:hypothetical protein